jgi:Nucleotidyl transferase AbiEii toxin, Type IV TA system
VAARSSRSGFHQQSSSVSGDSIHLVDAGDGSVSGLVHASGLVARHAGLPVALIGGLAVTCRLATAHRPTQDVDLVAETSADLVAGSLSAAESAAESVTISVVDTDVRAVLPVATPAALVAMKLHSIQDRSGDRKRASDAWDIFRLLEAHNGNGDINTAITGAPEGLATLIGSALDRMFRSEVTRTRRWIRVYGEPQWVPRMTDETMGRLATELIDSLVEAE